MSGETIGIRVSSKYGHINVIRLIRTITICFFLVFIFFILWIRSDRAKEFREKIKQDLSEELISTDLVCSGSKVDAIYILGGTQRSLKRKFMKAAEIYSERPGVKILLPHVDGITEYRVDLQRNLTNDEWSILNLKDSGIRVQDIECITISEGFFGSFSEAKAVCKLSRKRRYEGIILITGPYHTRRVKITFRSLSNEQETRCYVQASDESVPLRDLVFEFMKLIIYENLLVS